MATKDLVNDLKEVNEEFNLISEQIEDLLNRQQILTERKASLEQQIRDATQTNTSGDRIVQFSDFTKNDFPWSKKLNDIKTDVFKVKEFRPLQLQTMNATLSGKDCIIIMPTGGGKSLCFQLPALVSKGITLVVSPLISLMEDQLIALHELEINATLLNSNSSKEDVKNVHAEMANKNDPALKLLYVTPEKLAKSKRFMSYVEKMYHAGNLARLVIDEVHCCSTWGHDFRPDFKFLGIMKKQFPGVPILGLTATATSKVLQDVKKMLQIPDCVTYRASFNRHNLFYEVKQKPGTFILAMNEIEHTINTRFKKQSGIIYCFSRNDSEEVTRELRNRRIKAGCYHASVDSAYKSDMHKRWLRNEIQVVVATIAFGMGIDKPNVRFVIHFSMSKSIENYYQESGRAGRDDKKAYCILYTHFNDVFRQSTMVFTDQTGLGNLYGMVAYAYDASECRRSLIAKHFGERWDTAHCNQSCDHCDMAQKKDTNKRDVTAYCRDIFNILDHAKAIKQRVTGLKLLDAWFGKGQANLRLSHINAPPLSRFEAERVIAFMLINEYLVEDFHFTAYNTISYILQGSKAMILKKGLKTVEMEFVQGQPRAIKHKSNSSPAVLSSPARLKSSTSTSSASPKKPKTVFINPEKSAFTDLTVPVESNTTQSNAKQRAKKGKKRTSDQARNAASDEEDFDFGDQLETLVVTPKKKKRAKSSTENSVEVTKKDKVKKEKKIKTESVSNESSVDVSKAIKRTRKKKIKKELPCDINTCSISNKNVILKEEINEVIVTQGENDSDFKVTESGTPDCIVIGDSDNESNSGENGTDIQQMAAKILNTDNTNISRKDRHKLLHENKQKCATKVQFKQEGIFNKDSFDGTHESTELDTSVESESELYETYTKQLQTAHTSVTPTKPYQRILSQTLSPCDSVGDGERDNQHDESDFEILKQAFLEDIFTDSD